MFFLIGHRGVGKSSLLKGLSGCVDLDAVIGSKNEIKSIFSQKGEEFFRKLEFKKLDQIILENKAKVVALGAGFRVEKYKFPKNSKLIWVQRDSDNKGRIFFDRPRLTELEDPLLEFRETYRKRTLEFQKNNDFKFMLPEGSYETKETQDSLNKILIKNEISVPDNFYFTLEDLKQEGFHFENVELRTDLIEEKEVQRIIRKNKFKKIIVAIRGDITKEFIEFLKLEKNILIDVPVEMKEFQSIAKSLNNVFLSCHEELQEKELEGLLSLNRHLKWAPELKSIEELRKIDTLIKNKDVSFLPRSCEVSKGSFRWYRLLRSPRNKINFFRYGQNSYIDQPLYFELIKANSLSSTGHGAVLGGDVSLSYSPCFHREFFNKNFSSIYVSISLSILDFNRENLYFLKKIGIDKFSVTSPHKLAAGKLIDRSALNTLHFIDGEIEGENTDFSAMRILIEKIKKDESVSIWGSGAIGIQFKDLLKERAKLYSVREAFGRNIKIQSDVLIWVAGPHCKDFPIEGSRVSRVIDLEYKENSYARKVALDLGAEYISGSDFFRDQAVLQQNFWLKGVK